MSLIIPYLYLALTVLITPFFLFIALVTAAALVGRRRHVAASRPVRFLIVIPAHDEEESIRSTVESCRAVDYDPALYTVSVIADNCTDGTARVAREAGALVTERNDPDRRSKGYALEYFFERGLPPHPSGDYDAVVVIDADTVVDSGMLAAFARGVAAGQDWIQCYYTVRNPEDSWRTRLMTYAFSLFNGVFPLGLDRMGLGVPLRGNGMCFTTRGLARFPWKAYGLTEDLEFSWHLRTSGERIHFRPDTRVSASMLSRGGKAAAAQRRRWEDGRKSLRSELLRSLLRSRRLGPFPKLMHLIELLFPPLVTLLASVIAASSIYIFNYIDKSMQPMARRLLPAHVLMTAALMGYALSPFLVMGLPLRYLSSFLRVPHFAAWKLLITLTERRPTTWVRTPREPAAGDAIGSSTLPGGHVIR